VGAEVQDQVDARLKKKYGERLDQAYNRQCLFGLRPQVFMRVYVADDLWQALLESRAKGGHG